MKNEVSIVIKKEYEVPEVQEILVQPHVLYQGTMQDPIIDPD